MGKGFPKRHELEDEDDWETVTGHDGKPTRVLKDGRSVKIPLFLRDGAINPDLTPTQRVVAMDAADSRNARRFGLGDDGSAMHRPGYRFNTDQAAAEMIALAHALHDCEDEEAYSGRRADAVVSRTSASDGVRDERQAAYLDYERELSLAYLLPTRNERTGEGSHGPLETRKEGDVCMVRGNWGHLVEIDGELQCIPEQELSANSGSRDAATVQRQHQQKMRTLYDQIDAERAQEWRGQK